jgi:hypothetical protein
MGVEVSLGVENIVSRKENMATHEIVATCRIMLHGIAPNKNIGAY